MKHKTIAGKRMMGLTSMLLLFTLVLAACQAAATATQVAVATQKVVPTDTAMPVASTSEVTLQIATDPKLGQILVDGKGMTLYMYTKDTPDMSNCTGKCLTSWPPFITQGKPIAGTGVDASLIGTAKLADGSLIVTYNHMPLYYWIKDTKVGDVSGEGVGNVWYVLAPDGKPVGMAVAAAATPTVVAPMPASEVSLDVATDPKLGQILVDGKGMTLYMYTKDTADTSNCTGGCLAKWPPFLTQGKPTLGAGIDASLVGTAKLADGTMIVTYNHMPLYYWVNDTKPGDDSGQGVGSVWYVVAPDGKPVGMQVASASNPPSTSGASEATLKVADEPNLGKILVDGKGMTLYIFTNDGPNKSNCTGDCLAKWPPLLTQGKPILGDGIDPSLVGTAQLADGSMIVTYNKMPLYYWYKDTKAGDDLGQGVGSVWFVVSPDGKPIGN